MADRKPTEREIAEMTALMKGVMSEDEVRFALTREGPEPCWFCMKVDCECPSWSFDDLVGLD